MSASDEYEPINDWSLEGRRRLVEERGDQIRLLLDAAFTDFTDERGVNLREFRFRGEDPVTDAVEWSVEYFLRPHIDVEKLHTKSRSMRLFTEASFWLVHRESIAGYRRILARAQRGGPTSDAASDTSTSPDVLTATRVDARRFRERIIAGVLALRDACCASLVGWWLVGMARQRRLWFASDDPWTAWADAVALDDRSPKQRSFHVADALFRYFALFANLVQRDSNDLPHRACVLTWFTPCEDRPPYEVARRLVREALGGLPSRQMTTLRNDGVESLVRRCVELAGRSENGSDPLEDALSRASLRLSVLHRFHIEDAAIGRAIDALERHPR